MTIKEQDIIKHLFKALVFLALVIAGWAGTSIMTHETRLTNVEKSQVAVEGDVRAIREYMELWMKITGIDKLKNNDTSKSQESP